DEDVGLLDPEPSDGQHVLLLFVSAGKWTMPAGTLRRASTSGLPLSASRHHSSIVIPNWSRNPISARRSTNSFVYASVTSTSDTAGLVTASTSCIVTHGPSPITRSSFTNSR